MSNVNIEVFNISRTVVDKEEVRRWLDRLNVSEDFQLPENLSDPAALIALAAKRCYMSFEVGLNPNVTRIRQNYVEYIDNILKSMHGSCLEHSVYSFAIEGLSRICTAELNRHRAGWAISEGSLRFIRFDKDIPWWMPTSLQQNDEDNPELAEKKRITRELFEAEFNHQRDTYGKLIQLWEMDESDKNFSYKKKVTSCLRRIVGMGVATGGVWTGNIRALRHVIALRCSPAAEEEILYVFTKIFDMIREREPELFGDFVRDGNYLVPKYSKV